MQYRIEIKRSARKELDRLSKADRRRVGRKIDALGGDPCPRGAKKLKGRGDNAYRIRAGDYRILYTIENDVLVVFVIAIGHRKDIYRTP